MKIRHASIAVLALVAASLWCFYPTTAVMLKPYTEALAAALVAGALLLLVRRRYLLVAAVSVPLGFTRGVAPALACAALIHLVVRWREDGAAGSRPLRGQRGSALVMLAALALTVLGASAMFTVFTYIVPILRIETGAATPFVTAMLVLYGIGLTVGNWAGGRFADRSVDGTLVASLAGLVAVLVLFAWGMRWEIPAAILIFLWGVASFALVPPLQMRVSVTALSG